MKSAIVATALACVLAAPMADAATADGCSSHTKSGTTEERGDAPVQQSADGGPAFEYAIACLATPDPTAIDTLQIIDLRPADAIARRAIPGALRLPADHLVHSPFLDDGRPVLLIGEQGAMPDLVRHCSALRAAGYAIVHVQRGGTDAWFADHTNSSRGPPRSDEVSVADADTALRLLRWSHTLVLTPEHHTLPPGTRALRLPSKTGDATLADAARTAGVVLLIDDRTIPDVELARVQRITGMPPVVFDRGTDLLLALRAQQAHMRQAAQTPLTQDCRWN